MIKTDNLLAAALSQAIETMAFLNILPVEDDLPIPENTVLSQIGFTNSESGTIQMLAGLDFCKLLAENIGRTYVLLRKINIIWITHFINLFAIIL